MLKTQILTVCFNTINEKIQSLNHQLAQINESLNNETKSSAGDKYETGREMMSKELEKINSVLNELLKQKAALDKINPNFSSEVIQQGSLVSTDKGIFFISVSLGAITVQNSVVFCLSSASPLGALFVGKSKGDKISFNSTPYTISKVD